MKTVAVIGGGPAGLCTARHLVQSKIKPVVFEQQGSVGGAWVYENVDMNDPKDVFSSMYDNLRTNQPKEGMAFPDFPFPTNGPSYVHRTFVKRYLENYANHFRLHDYIHFNTRVEKISPCVSSANNDEGNPFVKWQVRSTNCKTSVKVFDGVVICNGHNSIPKYPDVPGLQHFKGRILHSHFYRRATDFKGLTSLVLGGGPSGTDIMLELAKECSKVYYSHRGDRSRSKLPLNILEMENVSHVREDSTFVFENNDTAKADVFIPATGYKYHFPFLDKDSGISTTGKIVEKLYKHLFNIKYPSMSIVGVPSTVSPFLLFHQQCVYICSVLSGQKTLPTADEMLFDTEIERLERLSSGEPPRYFHRMFYRQFRYKDELSALSGCTKDKKVFEKLYRYNMNLREVDLQGYKNTNYKILNDIDFEVLN